MSTPELRFSAPASLRTRINAVVPAPRTSAPSRRTMLKGFALGSLMSSAVAASLMITVMRSDQEERDLGEVVSAHLRSLQGEHLTDVLTSDQHTVKPWLSARLDVSPQVVELKDKGFPLVGGRMDYVDGHQAAVVVYRHAKHVINLFAWASPGKANTGLRAESQQGFNLVTWRHDGITYYAVSDVEADQLEEFARLIVQEG
jgi:anti-sigma factor RsiW